MRRLFIAPLLIAGLVISPATAASSAELPRLGSTDAEGPGLAESPDTGDSPAPGESSAPPAEPAPQDADVDSDSQTVEGGESAVIDLGPSDSAWATAAVETVTVMGAVWDPSEAPGSVSYRTKGDDGGWGAWEEFELADGAGPDDGTAEAAGSVAGTEPVVVADGETVEVRVEGSSSSAVSMDTVTTSTTSADEQIAQNSSYAAPGESDDPLGLVPLASAGASTARAGAGGFAAAPAAKTPA